MRRTQIYLSDDQLRSLRAVARAQRISMAEVIRGAVDAFLRRGATPDPAATLEAAFGALPGLVVPPRSEWDRHDA